ncbi:hypothetical protein Q0M94_03425 [Deinococcus radiomollis]|uniref:hypothetical protein n=1 Tax=Deinococcus radiomollis TaxID=468916 RepID=UPI00389298B8
MNRLQFVFDLIDRMSGPVGGIVSALDRLLGVTDRLGTATDRSSTRMGAAFTRLQSGMNTVKTRAEAFGHTMEGIHGSIERVFSLPNIIGGMVLGEVVKTVIEAGVQKEMTMANFKVMMGGDTKAATAAYGDMINFAGLTPIKTDVLQREWTRLLVDGFKEKAVPKLLSGIGDLSAMRGFSEESMTAIVRNLGEIKSFGHLTGRVVKDLSFWGLSRKKLDDAVAERMHVNPAQVGKLISSGRVDSNTGIMSIMDAIRTQLDGKGPLGTMMLQQSQTLGGLFSTLASRPMELFGGIADTEGFSTLKQLTKNLGDAFNPVSVKGERLQKVIIGILGKVTDLAVGPLVKLTDGDGLINAATKFAGYVQMGLDWWANNGPTVVALIQQFAHGFMDAAKGAMSLYNIAKPTLSWIGDTIEKLTGGKKGSMGGPLGTLAYILGGLALGGLVLKGGGLFLNGGAAFLGFLNTITFGILPKMIGLMPKLGLAIAGIGESTFFMEMMTNPAGLLAGFRAAMVGVGTSIAGMGASLAALALPFAFMADLALIVTDIKLFKDLQDQRAANKKSEAENAAALTRLANKGPLGDLTAQRLRLMQLPRTSTQYKDGLWAHITGQKQDVALDPGALAQRDAMIRQIDARIVAMGGKSVFSATATTVDAVKLGTTMANAFQDKLTAPGSIAAMFGVPTQGAGGAFGGGAFGGGALPSSSGVASGPNGSWAGYGASVYTDQIGMAADVLSKKLAAAGGDIWGASGGIRRYNGLGKNADGSWMNPDYISNVAAATRDQPWLAAMKKATGPRLDELNYINTQTDLIAKKKGIDPRTLKGLMWWESEGWHADLPGDQGRGGGLGQVLGYHVPPRGTGMGTIGSAKAAAPGHTISITQSFMVPAGATQQDAAAIAKAARQGTHEAVGSSLQRLSMHAGAS